MYISIFYIVSFLHKPARFKGVENLDQICTYGFLWNCGRGSKMSESIFRETSIGPNHWSYTFHRALLAVRLEVDWQKCLDAKLKGLPSAQSHYRRLVCNIKSTGINR